MYSNKDGFTIIDKSIGMNGPSMSLGAASMVIGVTCIFIGIGISEIKALLCGLVLVALAAF